MEQTWTPTLYMSGPSGKADIEIRLKHAPTEAVGRSCRRDDQRGFNNPIVLY